MKAALRTLVRRAACAWRPRTLVLAYHHVGNPAETAPWVTVTPAQFAEQMAFLAASRLVLPLDSLLAELRWGRVPRGGHVVLTFDDAALDTWTTAFPILRRHGLPATLFVPTGLVGRAGPFWWDRLARLSRTAAAKGRCLGTFLVGAGVFENGQPWSDNTLWRRVRLLEPSQRQEALDRAEAWLANDNEASPFVGRAFQPDRATEVGRERPACETGAMDWNHLAELDASGLITLGAHTVSHPVLAALDEEQLAAEVTGSRDRLAGWPSFRKVFAYPYGDAPAIGARVEQAVRQAGFEAAFTTDETALSGREDRLSLGRVCVDEMALSEFVWTIDHHLGCP